MRDDAGLSLRRLAAAAGIDDAYLGQIERGEREPSLTVLVAIATALGGDAWVRLYPGTGPRLRDPIQARIVEALLRVADPHWIRRVEVVVQRPVRGVIDLVLSDPTRSTWIAFEIHSELRRLEQQLRWANEKALALPSSDAWPSGPTLGRTVEPTIEPTIHRVLVLRRTRSNRALAARFAETLTSAYPASPADAYRALSQPGLPWPGSAFLWATLTGDVAKIGDRPIRAP